MRTKRLIFCFLALMVCLIVITIAHGSTTQKASEEKFNEYKMEFSKIKTMRDSFKPGPVNNLEDYVKFANEIQQKWKGKDKESYGRLMLEICKPLSSGTFPGDRRYDVAKKYALSVLEKPEEISVEMELELTGHIVTPMYTPNSPKGEDFAQRRKKDVEVRLHAWKRLKEAIDQNWDPNDEPLINVTPPHASGLPSGVAPEAIKDTKLRVEYEAAIEKNRQKAERYSEQNSLRKWLKRYPKRAEEYIILAYFYCPT